MPESITIPKLPNSSFPEYLNVGQLRALGIEHIQQLGKDLWTDYNVHDPGITILEVLCFALTDLGYRTNFDIKDLLASKDPSKSAPNFFTAEEILTCNPVTVNDLRKLLIDIPGIKNAWFERASEGEVDFYLGTVARENSQQKDPIFQYDLPVEGEDKKIKLGGLYDVCIEFDELYLLDTCGLPDDNRGAILDQVYQTLQAHRNLCEDIRGITTFDEETIGICADLELAPNAVPEDVLLNIFLKVEEFLSPSLRFYTLQELLGKDKAMEDIFEGRPMTENSHGFIDTEELKKLNPKSIIYTSDIIQEIMDVEGVIGVQNLLLVNYIDGHPQTTGEKWCLELTPKHSPHINLEQTASKLNMFKGVLPFRPNFAEVRRRYREEKTAGNKSYLDKKYLNKAEPRGTYREVDDYYSIQNDFPLTYGIGEDGIPGKVTAERKQQVKQLKAYLLFYDQILANYLMQLSRVRDLFSTKDQSEDFIPGQGTYFAQSLSEASVRNIEDLILNYHNCPDNNDDPPPPDDYWQYLNYIVEDEPTYYDRRNRFLDHLLARFGESFTDYVLLSFKLGEGKREQASIIQDKADFLHHYTTISHDRGKGYNYTKTEVWNTENVSGFEKRVAKLIGIDNIKRHTLCKGQPIGINDHYFFYFNLSDTTVPDTDPPNEDLPDHPFYTGDLISFRVYTSREDAEKDADTLEERLADPIAYRRINSQAMEEPKDGKVLPDAFSFLVLDENGKVLAQSRKYDQVETRDKIIQQFISHAVYPEGIDRSTEQETACYFYQLYDYTGEILLLEQVQGFDSEQTAYENNFYEFTKAEDFKYFKRIPEDGGYSFKLKDPEALEEDSIAIRPEYLGKFQSANERDDYLAAIYYYMASPPNQFPYVLGEPGAYTFEIRDAGDQIVFEGVPVYDTARKAHLGADKALYLAQFHVYFHLQDEMEGEFPYGFELKNRKNELFATHPTRYRTECERDLVVDSIVFALNDASKAYRIVEIEGLYYYELIDHTDRAYNPILMRSSTGYLNDDDAREGLQEFKDHATESANYESFQNDEEAYTFHLKNADGEIIAVHPSAYEWEKEQKMALKAILNLVRNDEFSKLIQGDPGTYDVLLQINENRQQADGTERILLKTPQQFPDKYVANQAFEEMLRLATDENNYEDTSEDEENGPYGFVLKDTEGNIFAIHPESYPTKPERDAARFLTINCIRKDSPNYKIDNKTGAFYVEILGRDDASMLIGNTILKRIDEAQAHEVDLLNLARVRGSYRKTGPVKGEEPSEEDMQVSCEYSFELIDEEGQALAYHPRSYASEEERDAVVFDFFTYITDGASLAEQLVYPVFDENQLFFTFPKNDAPFLKGTHFYGSPESLLAAFGNVLTWPLEEINYLVVEAPEGGAPYRLFIKNAASSEGHLAEFIDDFGSYDEAIEARNNAITYFNTNPTEPDIHPRQVYTYKIQDFSDNILIEVVKDLESKEVLTFSEKQQAIDHYLHHFLPRATSKENFVLHYDNENCRYSYEIKASEAGPYWTHHEYFGNRTDRDRAIQLVLSLLNGREGVRYFTVKEAETKNIKGWSYLLQDTLGRPLFKPFSGSNKSEILIFEDKQTAEEHFTKVLQPLGSIAGQYTKRNDPLQSIYTFYLKHAKQTVLWSHENHFTSQADRDQGIDQVVRLLQEGTVAEKDSLIHGQGCGIFFQLHFNDEEISEEHPEGVTFKSQTYYPDELRAKQACNELIIGLQEALGEGHSADEFFELGGAWTIYLKDTDNQIRMSLIEPQLSEEEEEKAQELMAELITIMESDEKRGFNTGAMTFGDISEASYHFAFSISAEGTQKEESLLGVIPIKKEAVSSINDPGEDQSEEEKAEDLACSQANEILERIQEDLYIALLEDEEKCLYGFEVYSKPQFGEPSRRMAYHQQFYATQEERDTQLEALRTYVNDEGMHLVEHILLRPMEYEEVLPVNYYFEFAQGEEILLKSNEKRKPGSDCDFESPVDEKSARADIVRIHQLLNTEEPAFKQHPLSDDVDTLYELQLIDPEENEKVLAIHPKSLAPEAVEEVKTAIREAFGVLSRTSYSETDQAYFFEIFTPDKVLVSSPTIYETEEKARQALRNFRNLFVTAEERLFKILSDDSPENEKTLAVVDPEDEEKVLAFYPEKKNAQELDQEYEAFLKPIFEQTPFGLFSADTCFFTEKILKSCFGPSKTISDDFLPPAECKVDESDGFSPELADPYSFRATIVLPYWPERFRQIEFRNFVEQTLRREAPAHIFLRICWIGVCQMCEFEEAYRTWLAAKALGDDSCSIQQAKSELINLLTQLRNVYPEGSLSDCGVDAESNDNPIILNQTVLGTG